MKSLLTRFSIAVLLVASPAFAEDFSPVGQSHTTGARAVVDQATDELIISGTLKMGSSTTAAGFDAGVLTARQIDHGSEVTGLGDDDHPQYSLADGTRDFVGPVAGVTPVDDEDLATKAYVDSAISTGTASLDHGGLSGLGDDDHTIYSLVDGTRAFTGTVGGITPSASSDLATKGYVDGAVFSGDHGALSGLADDDHTQYHNDARGDARYYTETELDAGQLDNRYFTESEHLDTSAGAGDAGKPVKLDAGGQIDATMVNDADIDHGSIGGLTDDDHTQYLRTDGTRALAGAWSMGSQATTNVNLDSGAIDGVTIGGTTPAAGSFTTLSASSTAGITGVLTASAGVVGPSITPSGSLLSIYGRTDIQNASLVIDSGYGFFLDGGSNTYIYEPSADNIVAVAGGTARLTVNSSGITVAGSGTIGNSSNTREFSIGIHDFVQSSSSSVTVDSAAVHMATHADQIYYPINAGIGSKIKSVSVGYSPTGTSGSASFTLAIIKNAYTSAIPTTMASTTVGGFAYNAADAIGTITDSVTEAMVSDTSYGILMTLNIISGDAGFDLRSVNITFEERVY